MLGPLPATVTHNSMYACFGRCLGWLAAATISVHVVDGSASGGQLIAFACGVWDDDEVLLKPTFKETAVECFKAQVCAMDQYARVHTQAEKARHEINNRVSEATKGSSPTIRDLSGRKDICWPIIKPTYEQQE